MKTPSTATKSSAQTGLPAEKLRTASTIAAIDTMNETGTRRLDEKRNRTATASAPVARNVTSRVMEHHFGHDRLSEELNRSQMGGWRKEPPLDLSIAKAQGGGVIFEVK